MLERDWERSSRWRDWRWRRSESGQCRLCCSFEQGEMAHVQELGIAHVVVVSMIP